jgi:hypothetical protein
MTQPSSPQMNRRRWFAGAGAVGAVAAVAAVAPVATVTTEASPTKKPAPNRGGGYTVSEHIKRYYQTTRV